MDARQFRGSAIRALARNQTMKRTDKPIIIPPVNRGNRPAAKHTGKRLLVLAAAVAVPAMAAPADWSQIGPGPAELVRADAPGIAPMPFEVGGSSFPGSAFYYLEETPQAAYYLPSIDPLDIPDEQEIAALGTEIDAGPSASAFLSRGTGLDKARALKCMTQAIYYEAASESEAGQRAVAQVVLNRVSHSAWPSSVCGVVYEGSTRVTGCQFSFTCDGSMRRKPSSSGWARAQRVAARSLSGEVYQPIGLATHYHTNWVNPYWAPTLNYVGTIGAHRFYKMHGRNGTQAAFKGRYAGVERIPSPNLGRKQAPELPLTGSYLPEISAPTTGYSNFAPIPPVPAARPSAAPARNAPAQSPDPYANSSVLPGAGQVKDEYAGSGQWINAPGSRPGSRPGSGPNSGGGITP